MQISTDRLSKCYPMKGKKGRAFYAVREAAIHINPGETVGLWGASGSGKTTLGMMLAGLIPKSSGEIRLNGAPLSYPFRGDVRKNIQILFQHPEVSFNPALQVIRSMTEPFALHNPPFTRAKLLSAMEPMGLYEEHLARYPSELSGGELQRLALTRLLVLRPSLIVLDEPTSMLDVISQAQIIGLLKEYQQASGAAFVFITHHRTLAHTLCDRIYHVQEGIFQEIEKGRMAGKAEHAG